MTGSIIPPDVRANLAKQTRGGGIGGGAPENAGAAQARRMAMDPTAAAAEAEEAAAPEVDEREELKACPRPTCRITLEDEWNFCAKCGTDLIRGGPAKKLGIEFTDQDLEDYVFKGYVLREVAILGSHKMLLKSAQPKDVAEADNYLMNGAWRKDVAGKERQVTEFFLRQVNQLCITASTIQKMDGQPLGKTFDEKMTWFEERGSAMVDMMGAKVILFNQALTEFLTKADIAKGS
jgi:hypothetical protein